MHVFWEFLMRPMFEQLSAQLRWHVYIPPYDFYVLYKQHELKMKRNK